jgi:hypothetical protein
MKFPAPYAALLRERPVCTGLLLSGVGLVVANLLGWKVWLCGFREFTGLPCPGCGMTRSMAALTHGHWESGIAHHPLGPLLFLGALSTAIITLLPQRSRTQILPYIQASEQRTGWTLLCCTALLGYGLYRMGRIILQTQG